ncbi:TPA: hypothetical protein U1741_000468 [Streptococcus suis]|uniref:hypothetical protein n=1 Tax=Streptococcus suis TaxID=1307 RepID=UPI0005CD9222|nr:hypothetical protein [Streptococcus suis]NQR01244.1 hypothetical protein [Streptococcus suis]NQR72799.1 hypothetical protein [Streptococcus suis]NQS32939.1 hypothetical protein [Streptococcus suis]CYX27443.1 Uncharacterised protein [Streptococcus suis]HEM5621417.1 hypothetical protein [Streptococcus suis]
MKNFRKKIISSILALLLFFSGMIGSIPVYASEDIDNKVYPVTNEIANNFAEMSKIASKSYDVKDKEIKSKYIGLSKNEIEKHNFIVNGNKNNLNFEEVNVVKINLDDSEYTSVNIPIAGKYSTLSNINILFDKNNKFIGYTETLIYNNPEINKFVIDNYQNGVLLEHKETSIDFISNEKIKEGLQGLKKIGNQPSTRGLGATAACIGALLGVNGVVAYLIAGTCTTACAAAPITGTVCAACIGGICVIGAADIGAIIACFKL